jgi:hypothetical protein
MAQYLPYIPETIPEPALYKPDFNFFDRMLQRKQSMFEQGASRVRSAYTSVLNAPLSNKNNIPLRDQYIKDAQEQLTKISSSDLSLMENVNAAESIYAPFWQDKFIVQDAAMTKAYQTEMQKYASWKDAAKPEDREKYNNIGMIYLQNGLSKLQNAERTPEAFGSVEMRKAEPFTNIESYLQKMATADKLEIKYDSPDGPYLIETKNGQRSEKKYATWATGMIGNNFQGQFMVTGTVENEERAKILKRNNPTLTDADVKSLIAKDAISELKQGFTKRHQEVDVELARVDSLLTSIGQTGGPNNKGMFDKLVEQRAELTANKVSINEEYKGFDQDKDKLLEYVTSAPNQYFSVLAKQRLVNNWAIGKANIDEKLVKKNEGFVAAQDYELRRATHELATIKVAYEREQDLWERANPTTNSKSNTTRDSNGNIIPTSPAEVVPGIDESKSIVYSGVSGTAVERTASSIYNIFNKQQEERFTIGHNLLFTQQGLLGLTKDLGLKQGEIADVATAFQSEINTKYNHTFTKDQAAASTRLSDLLLASPAVKDAGITKITGPGTMKNALIAYSTNYFAEKIKNNIPFTEEEKEAQKNMVASVRNLEVYNANEAKRKELIKTNLLNNKALSHLVVDTSLGEKDLVSISDLEKKFKATDFEDEDGNKVNISAKDLATAYMSGNMTAYRPGFFASIAAAQSARAAGTVTFGKTVTIDGKKYSSQGTLTPNMLSPSKPFTNYPKGLEELESTVLSLNKTYTSSQQLSKDINTAHLNVVPNLLDYKNLSGTQSKEFKLNFKSTKTMTDGDNAALAVYQATQPGNMDMVYDENGQIVPDTHIKAMNTLLKNEKNIEEYVSAEYIPDGKDGKKTLRLTLSKVRDDEGKDGKIADVNISDLKTQYNYTLKENTATYLDGLYKSASFQIFEGIVKGEEFKSDPMLEAAGFKFSIIPNLKGVGANPSFVTIDVNYKARVNKKDPQTGELTSNIEDKSYLSRISLKGDTAKGPDEIVNAVYDVLYNNISENNRLEKEYKYYIDNKNKTGGASWDAKAALQAAGLSHLIK